MSVNKKGDVVKLYKFRSLDKSQMCWTKNVIETGRFWCSRFWALNDAMEGVYRLERPSLVETIYREKSSYAICSFSGEQALRNPSMWGHYANGFKGIAIEFTVDSDLFRTSRCAKKGKILPVKYSNMLVSGDNVETILTSKLCCWSYEDEYRFLVEGARCGRCVAGDPCNSGYPCTSGVKCKIDNSAITAVYFGAPYEGTENYGDIQSQDLIAEYKQNEKDLLSSIKGLNDERSKLDPPLLPIECFRIDIENGGVVDYPLGQVGSP